MMPIKILRLNIFWFVFTVLIFVMASPIEASPDKDFQRGWNEFHALLKNSRDSQFRSSWIAIRNIFLNVYKEAPDGPSAPKALYYLGRVHEELGRRSGLETDKHLALDYYQRVVSKFPSHSWADDALFRKAKAEMELLSDDAQAYIDLLHIIHAYPKGDMFEAAQKELAKLDKKNRRLVKSPVQDTPKDSAKGKELAAVSPTPPAPLRIEPRPASTPSASPGKRSGQTPELTSIRHWSGPDYTRVVLDLDSSATYTHRLLNPDPKLKTPSRLFIDLECIGTASDIPSKLTIKNSVVREIRVGQRTGDVTRVVLDIESLKNAKVFNLEDPYRIVVDVYTPPPSAASPPSRTAAKPATPKGQELRIEINESSKSMAGTLVEQLGLKLQTVMIDPGHGGKDPGATHGKIYEKDINLRFAKILGKQLEDKGLKILYTRTTDVFLSLEERTALANAQGVDLFLSIHCNAHPSSSASGLEVYFLNLAKNKDAVRVAARENAVSERKISDLQFILTDLMLSSKIKESQDLAHHVHSTALKTMAKDYRLKDHGIRQAPFYVLMGAKMPAVLIELGYLTNAKERAMLQSDAYLRKLASGLAGGVMAYKNKIEQFASL
ncbi:MAG: N-acetylmuramoyl-L-alanine amidase [Deltaproteobacteria bacterium]|nr:N-acetylmuramoyl-L-alanine amidase [Deltaproteobacteria bacterium]